MGARSAGLRRPRRAPKRLRLRSRIEERAGHREAPGGLTGGRGGRFRASCTLLDHAHRQLLALLARHRRLVHAEGHRHRRLLHRDRLERPRVVQVDHRVADVEVLDARERDDVARRRLLHGRAPHRVEGKELRHLGGGRCARDAEMQPRCMRGVAEVQARRRRGADKVQFGAVRGAWHLDLRGLAARPRAQPHLLRLAQHARADAADAEPANEVVVADVRDLQLQRPFEVGARAARRAEAGRAGG